MSIRLFKADDWKAVAEIYEQGLLTRNATFETQVPDYNSWIKRFHSRSYFGGAIATLLQCSNYLCRPLIVLGFGFAAAILRKPSLLHKYFKVQLKS